MNIVSANMRERNIYDVAIKYRDLSLYRGCNVRIKKKLILHVLPVSKITMSGNVTFIALPFNSASL